MKNKKHLKILKKITIIFLCVILCLSFIVFINFIPTFKLETKGMNVLKGNWIDLYYEKEYNAAKDVFDYADSEAETIAAKLGFDRKQNVKVYVYDNQKTMQQKKYGLIGPLLGLDWYIGDNIGTNVILTSPANPGPVHDYNNNKYAVAHEIVHAYISVINPKIHLWLTEGCALYLTNGEKFNADYLKTMLIPSYSDTQTKNPIRFEKFGGYTFAQTYIEFLDTTYGWNKVLEIIKTEDYNKVFKKSQREIYNDWVNFIKTY